MCYKEADLDFENIRLACLSGENGAGKSSIFDAMTWALWGKARASHDEIIMSGEIEMQVDFEFEVNNQHCRVVRTRSRKGSGTTQVSFQLKKDESSWQNISGNTVRETDRRIVEYIKMEYDTFVNSAFLRQGRADEFTIKTPTERKKVLAEILGLDFYDTLETKAKEEWKVLEGERRLLNIRLDEIDVELNLRPQYEQKKKVASEKVTEFKKTLVENEKQVSELQAIVNNLKNKQQLLDDTLRRSEVDRQDLAELQGKLPSLEQRVRQAEAIIARSKDIEAGFKDYEIAAAAYDEMTKKFQRYNWLLERRRALEKQIAAASEDLKVDIRTIQRQITDAEAKSRDLATFEKQQATLQRELETCQTAAERIEELKVERDNFQVDVRTLESEIARAETLLEEIKEKALQVPPVGEVCDHCGQLLTEAAREQTLAQRRELYKVQRDEVAAKKAQQKKSQANLSQILAALKELEVPARKFKDVQTRLLKAENELTAAKEAGEKVTALNQKIQELQKRLESPDFCAAERADLEEVNREARDLSFDHSALQRLKEKMESLKKFTDEKNSLTNALANIEISRESVADNRNRQTKLSQQVAEAKATIEQLRKEVADFDRISHRLESATDTKKETQVQLKIYEKDLWDAEDKLKNCDDLAEQKKQKTAQLTKVASDIQIFKDLEQAFGKKGVQALIIESVLPELEEETNTLLNRMTDGRMSIRFDTQANTKKGDPIETLELKISDENGVRAYELFSGGEAFRINFAVRVALSKLLARRSGAALRTLIVDEGFGTQDGSGRERLVEAIRNIENEFDRILVITHIQELKDAFPVRIDVTKTSLGSRISVN